MAPGPLECLSQEQLETLGEQNDADPLTGTPELFQDGSFNYFETVPLDKPARITAIARGRDGLACTDWEPGTPFSLTGIDLSDANSGALRIDPLREGDFTPTVLNRLGLRGLASYLPVFSSEQITDIFADIEIEPDPDKAQIMVVLVSGTLPNGMYFVQSGVRVSSSFAQTVAYKNGATWTTDLEATTEDGLALLVNVSGYSTLEDTRPVVFEGAMEEQHDLVAGEGAVNYALVVVGSG